VHITLQCCKSNLLPTRKKTQQCLLIVEEEQVLSPINKCCFKTKKSQKNSFHTYLTTTRFFAHLYDPMIAVFYVSSFHQQDSFYTYFLSNSISFYIFLCIFPLQEEGGVGGGREM